MATPLLDKAKAGIVLDHPFFATLLLSMQMVEDESIRCPTSGLPTMATDGNTIRYHKEFMEGRTLPELTFVLAHETLHCVFEHMFNRGERTPNRWNQAADYVINEMLINERIGTMPAGGLHNPQLTAAGNHTTVGVYDLLPEDCEKNGAGSVGGALDMVQDASNDPATKNAAKADMQVRVMQARNNAKAMGKLSSGIERLVGELTRPKIDWKAALRRFVQQRAKLDLSYAKPKRRFLGEDLCLPSLVGEKIGWIAIGSDESGSICPKTLDAFMSEIKAIHEDFRPSIKIYHFDSEVTSVQSFGPEDEIDFKPTGGGGTAFSPVFEAINEELVPPVACIMLTDLCCSDFGDMPSYPVLWASTDLSGQAPWGEVLPLEL